MIKKSILFLLATVLAACQVDSYDSGDGEYSMLTADFVEAHTSQASAVDYAVTDGGDSLVMQQPLSADWADKADTLYRAILYYDHAEGTAVQARSIVQVPVLRPNPPSAFGTVRTDPVDLESVWLSPSGKYLNIGLYVKVGEGGPQGARHTVGLVCDSVGVSQAGGRTAYLRFYHDQGGVPQYYSSKTYVSIGCASLRADSVELAVETYDGTSVRCFRLSEQ